MKLLLSLCFATLCIVAYILYYQTETSATYDGLPTVPCLDYTQPIMQNFSFSLHISILGKVYPLEPTIGHDFGNCLHDIFVQDASGTVFIKANDDEQFSLGQFFDVWHKTFSSNQLFRYQAESSNNLTVMVNNVLVTTGRATLLQPNQNIVVTYH